MYQKLFLRKSVVGLIVVVVVVCLSSVTEGLCLVVKEIGDLLLCPFTRICFVDFEFFLCARLWADNTASVKLFHSFMFHLTAYELFPLLMLVLYDFSSEGVIQELFVKCVDIWEFTIRNFIKLEKCDDVDFLKEISDVGVF